MLPSATELTYFFEVANMKNLSYAAMNLGISQPALSKAIKSLEKTVGVDLFIRHKKGVLLTPAGKKLLMQVELLLNCWQNTKIHTLSSHQNVGGHIKIGCHTTVGLFIHGFLSELIDNYPQLDIEIKNASSTWITQQVINLNIDIGIVTNPILHPDLIIRKISETETTLWIGKGSRRRHNIHSSESILICNPKFYHTPIFLKKCKEVNLKFNRVLRVDSIETIASLTANGCGIGFLPSSFVTNIYADKLKRISNAPVITDELFLIYRKEYVNVKTIKAVISKIKEKHKAEKSYG